MGWNTFASWCINGVLYEWGWGLFALWMYNGMSKMWRLTSHNDYKTITLIESENCINELKLEPISLWTIWKLDSIWISSYSLICETRCWPIGYKTSQLCTFCPKHFPTFEYHMLIQCYIFDDIWLCSVCQTCSSVWVLHFNTMLCLWSYLIMRSTHIWPNPIIAQISLITTMYAHNS